MNKIIYGIIFYGVTLLWVNGTGFAEPLPIEKESQSVQNAIVEISTVVNSPNYFRPWSMMGPQNVSGSGVIIKGNRILTNAHVVADHVFIQVRKYGEAKRYKARILNVSHEADLALLTVDYQEFFSNSVALEFGELPQLRAEVLVYGFPFGGNSLSITKGILSRIEHQRFSHSNSYFLAGQLDASINLGNSGGPVIANGKIVGIVMQAWRPSHSENIGYMVPIPIIHHFLKDVEDGHYDGFPSIGLATQKLVNADMKRYYQVPDSQTGILVNHVFLNSPAQGKIKEGDILLKIDDYSIADDGTIELRPKERTPFKYCIDLRQMGEKIHLTILRKGVIQEIALTLNQTERAYLLAPRDQYDQSPRYFIFGGFVFTPLTYNLVKRWGKKWRRNAPRELVMELSKWPTAERTEAVVALETLPADINKGYHNMKNWIVKDVNGKRFKNFDEFYQIITSSSDPFIVLKNSKNLQIVIDRKQAELNHQKLLSTYRIPEDRSFDLRQKTLSLQSINH